MNQHQTHRALAVIGLLLLLQACGGGDGDDAPTASSSAVETSVEQAAAAPQSTASDAPSSDDRTASAQAVSAGSACGLPDFQAEALRLINARRAAGANCGARGSFARVPALSWNAALGRAAHGHSYDMASRNFFSHTGSDGRTLGTRVTAAGYVWGGVAENIAAGHRSVRAVVDGWMASPGHCANIMGSGYRDLGLACVNNSASRYGTYWTLDLARPR